MRNPYGDAGATCHYSLTQADAVFVQTPEQQALLRERFGRDGVVIPNPIDLVQWDSRKNRPIDEEFTGGLSQFVLWIGRAESIHKRPQVLLEIARLCPEVPFLMILNPRDPAVDAATRRQAPPNVRIVSQVPFPSMPALFSASTCVCEQFVAGGVSERDAAGGRESSSHRQPRGRAGVSQRIAVRCLHSRRH